jgi:homoserine O-acetyltransferase/O-succinyltransferase
MRFLLTALLLLSLNGHGQTQQTPQIAEMGTCVLENGQSIQQCRIGYLTVGKLNASRSNAILFPTWYRGKSPELLKHLGEDNLIDTSKYFVILVDSFGNGVSSSPSNSVTQSGAAFPQFSIRDMVRQQKRFLDEKFGLKKLHAVVGVSMGAMQAIEWSVSETAMAEKFVAIAGSPKLAPFDTVFWQTQVQLLRAVIDCKCQEPLEVLAGIRFLLAGAENQSVSVQSERLQKLRTDFAKTLVTEGNAYDRISQMQAMMGHDVSKTMSNDFEQAAKQSGKKLLMVLGTKDITVTPLPARDFAKLGDIKTHELQTCGHNIPICAADLINPAVRDFLTR